MWEKEQVAEPWLSDLAAEVMPLLRRIEASADHQQRDVAIVELSERLEAIEDSGLTSE